MPGVFLCGTRETPPFNFWRCMDINEPMINEEIRDREVRVVATDGTQLGVMSTQAALQLA